MDEAFTNPLPIKVTSYPRSWTATFTVPATPHDKTYEIAFTALSLTIPDTLKTSIMPWELSFRQDTGDEMTSRYGVTGGGDAFVIFATVIHALKVFSRLFTARPFIVFTAKEASRQKLYDRFVRLVAAAVPGMHGFKLANTRASREVLGDRGGGSSYVIVPKHISQKTVVGLIDVWYKKTTTGAREFL